MDPVTHTLAGALMARAGFSRLSPLAGPTVLVAANLPDIDGLWYAVDWDRALAYRHSLTHGIAAMVFLPAILAGIMLGIDRVVRRGRRLSRDAADPGTLLLAALAGVLSHIVLDWLTTYGVRVLAPISSHWFYGDTLYIVDPWFWLLLGAPFVLTWSHSWPRRLTLLSVGTGMVALMLGSGRFPLPLVAVWLAAVGALVASRVRWPHLAPETVARRGLGMAVLYVVLSIHASGLAVSQATAAAASLGTGTSATASCIPVAGQPWVRHVVIGRPSEYLVMTVRWPTGVAADVIPQHLPRGPYSTIIQAALDSEQISGLRDWLRYPTYEVAPRSAGGHRVILRDARFQAGEPAGYGVVGIIDVLPGGRTVLVPWPPAR